MSTRATYKINGHTFYIHHDGYPSGAAEYFKEAVHYPERTSIEADFFRANKRAKFTDGHEAHGDTEFRYTVANNTHLVCEEAVFRSGIDKSSWSKFFTGSVAEFLNQYLDDDEVYDTYSNRTWSHSWLCDMAITSLTQAKDAFNNGWTGNAQAYIRDAEGINGVLNSDLVSEEVKKLKAVDTTAPS